MTPARTPISIIRDHLEDWRRANDWSRETLAQEIVEAHERMGLDRLTGVRFEPPAQDTFKRMRVNADRVYRWLDDHSKETNLLVVNLLWSVLAAMPVERRVALVEALLEPVGLSVLLGEEEDHATDPAAIQAVVLHIQAVATHSADATVNLSQMLDGVHPGEAEAAKKSLSKLGAVAQKAARLMNRLLRRKGAPS